jgi:hypothetical protein
MTKVKNEMNQTKRVYIRPAMEIMDIEMEQVMLSTSNGGQTEDLGDVKEEIGWGATSRRGSWGDLWSK